MTTVSLSTRVPSVGLWLKTTPSSTSELDTRTHLGREALLLDLVDRIRLLEADDVGDGHGLLALELPLDRVVEEQAQRRARARTVPIARSHGQSGRPRFGGSYCGGGGRRADLRRCGRVEPALAGEHHGRGLRGLGRDASSARDRLEVGVESRRPTGSDRQAPSRARARRRGRGRAGTSERRSDGAGGISPRCFIAISTGLSPVNGTSPVRSSKSTIPVE